MVRKVTREIKAKPAPKDQKGHEDRLVQMVRKAIKAIRVIVANKEYKVFRGQKALKVFRAYKERKVLEGTKVTQVLVVKRAILEQLALLVQMVLA